MLNTITDFPATKESTKSNHLILFNVASPYGNCLYNLDHGLLELTLSRYAGSNRMLTGGRRNFYREGRLRAKSCFTKSLCRQSWIVNWEKNSAIKAVQKVEYCCKYLATRWRAIWRNVTLLNINMNEVAWGWKKSRPCSTLPTESFMKSNKN